MTGIAWLVWSRVAGLMVVRDAECPDVVSTDVDVVAPRRSLALYAAYVFSFA